MLADVTTIRIHAYITCFGGGAARITVRGVIETYRSTADLSFLKFRFLT